MFLLVGLDPVKERLPEFFLRKKYPFFEFCKAVVDATFDLEILGYKPNSAFFEAEGERGIRELKMVVDYINKKSGAKSARLSSSVAQANSGQEKRKTGRLLVILDAKRGDIGSTNLGYLKYAFEYLKVDGITLHPYLGRESLREFLEYSKKNDRLLFILCKTSNKGAEEFQDLKLEEGLRLYEKIALQVKNFWAKQGNCGLVVGATYPEDLKRVRKLVGDDLPILAPGVGAQGGDLKTTLEAGGYYRGAKLFVPIFRAIIYPQVESLTEFKDRVREKTKQFLQQY